MSGFRFSSLEIPIRSNSNSQSPILTSNFLGFSFLFQTTLPDMLQGVPIGLAFGTMPFILKSHSSYSDIAIFALSTYPYSLKLFWSPIVDSLFVENLKLNLPGWNVQFGLGRRKSWIVPIQALLGAMLWFLSGRIEDLINQVSMKYIVHNRQIITLPHSGRESDEKRDAQDWTENTARHTYIVLVWHSHLEHFPALFRHQTSPTCWSPLFSSPLFFSSLLHPQMIANSRHQIDNSDLFRPYIFRCNSRYSSRRVGADLVISGECRLCFHCSDCRDQYWLLHELHCLLGLEQRRIRVSAIRGRNL